DGRQLTALDVVEPGAIGHPAFEGHRPTHGRTLQAQSRLGASPLGAITPSGSATKTSNALKVRPARVVCRPMYRIRTSVPGRTCIRRARNAAGNGKVTRPSELSSVPSLPYCPSCWPSHRPSSLAPTVSHLWNCPCPICRHRRRLPIQSFLL